MFDILRLINVTESIRKMTNLAKKIVSTDYCNRRHIIKRHTDMLEVYLKFHSKLKNYISYHYIQFSLHTRHNSAKD